VARLTSYKPIRFLLSSIRVGHVTVTNAAGLRRPSMADSISVCRLVYWSTDACVSQKILPEFFWHFSRNVWECLVQILRAYCTFLSTLDYEFLFNYLQLWQSYAILSATTVMCSKCPPSVETHAGWSHLIWHNFVRVTHTGICRPSKQVDSLIYYQPVKIGVQ